MYSCDQQLGYSPLHVCTVPATFETPVPISVVYMTAFVSERQSKGVALLCCLHLWSTYQLSVLIICAMSTAYT